MLFVMLTHDNKVNYHWNTNNSIEEKNSSEDFTVGEYVLGDLALLAEFHLETAQTRTKRRAPRVGVEFSPALVCQKELKSQSVQHEAFRKL